MLGQHLSPVCPASCKFPPVRPALVPTPLQSVTSVDLDDFPIPTSERSARTAVIAYTASFFSGMPFQVRPWRQRITLSVLSLVVQGQVASAGQQGARG